MRVRFILVTAAVITAITAAASPGLAASITDIPGIPMPDNQFATGTIESRPTVATTSTPDVISDNVYSVTLPAGKWCWAYLEAPAKTTDFDLYLFGSEAKRVFDTIPSRVWSEHEDTSIEWLRYKSTETTTAYLDVYAFSGKGTYSLTYGSGSAEATISATAPTTCNYSAPTTITGSVNAAANSVGLSGIKVYLLTKKGTSTYTKVAETTTNVDGRYNFVVKPTAATTYQVLAFGDSVYAVTNTPATRTIRPRASVTLPTVRSTMYRYHSYSISGYLKPYDTRSKSVKIRCYRWDGHSYVWKKTVLVTNYYYNSSTRKYKGYLSLSPGKWHIRSYVSSTSAFDSAWSPGYIYRNVR